MRLEIEAIYRLASMRSLADNIARMTTAFSAEYLWRGFEGTEEEAEVFEPSRKAVEQVRALESCCRAFVEALDPLLVEVERVSTRDEPRADD
jgi:type VI protein secretion system component VasF